MAQMAQLIYPQIQKVKRYVPRKVRKPVENFAISKFATDRKFSSSSNGNKVGIMPRFCHMLVDLEVSVRPVCVEMDILFNSIDIHRKITAANCKRCCLHIFLTMHDVYIYIGWRLGVPREPMHFWCSHGAVAVTTASTKLHPQGFNNSQSNALHMTLYHPPHPPTIPHPPSVNNNDTCNVTTSSTKQHPQGFNKSVSNAVHMTLLHPPPTPPSLYHNDVYSTWQDWGFLEAPGNPQPWPYIYIFYIII